ARRIVDAVDRGHRRVVPGWSQRGVDVLGRRLSFIVDRNRRPEPTAESRDECWAITGFADGIGRALAREIAGTRSASIVGIDRDESRARATAAELRERDTRCEVVLADLAVPTDRSAIVDRIGEGARLSGFVHNAGISAFGPFLESDPSHIAAVIAVNLEAPLVLTADLLRQGRADRHTRWVFVSSLSEKTGYPGASVYAATKAALASFARSLRGQGYCVTTVQPGPTRTEHARRYSPDNRREHRRMDPARLAREVHRAVERHRREVVPGFGPRLLAVFGSWAPTLSRRLLARALLPPPRSGEVERSVGR
ncbi:MAG: SDR family NAD(P)-dependent oxidoreductase, partial [Planctomycetes bacterium]|nr:SDR family NAD(P)-dependent oxidoreductase [Planctomycetota bacterium]